jgi:hypothetical protein
MCLAYGPVMRATERSMYGLLECENDGWISSYINGTDARATIPSHEVEASLMTQTRTDPDHLYEFSYFYVYVVCRTNNIHRSLCVLCSMY